jgi:hypothetical protein
MLPLAAIVSGVIVLVVGMIVGRLTVVTSAVDTLPVD